MKRKNMISGRELFERYLLYEGIGPDDGTGEWDFLSSGFRFRAADAQARAAPAVEVLVCRVVPVAIYRLRGDRKVKHRVAADGKVS